MLDVGHLRHPSLPLKADPSPFQTYLPTSSTEFLPDRLLPFRALSSPLTRGRSRNRSTWVISIIVSLSPVNVRALRFSLARVPSLLSFAPSPLPSCPFAFFWLMDLPRPFFFHGLKSPLVRSRLVQSFFLATRPRFKSTFSFPLRPSFLSVKSLRRTFAGGSESCQRPFGISSTSFRDFLRYLIF